MALKSTDDRWSSIIQWLHWLMALAILGNGVVGLIMVDMSRGMTKLNIFAIHKSIGLTVLALLVVRVSWRLLDRRPRLYNSAKGNPLQWFKLFNLPALMEKNETLSELALLGHQTLFWALCIVLSGHIAGALIHHWFERDNTLLRMLPFTRLRARQNGDRP